MGLVKNPVAKVGCDFMAGVILATGAQTWHGVVFRGILSARFGAGDWQADVGDDDLPFILPAHRTVVIKAATTLLQHQAAGTCQLLELLKKAAAKKASAKEAGSPKDTGAPLTPAALDATGKPAVAASTQTATGVASVAASTLAATDAASGASVAAGPQPAPGATGGALAAVGDSIGDAFSADGTLGGGPGTVTPAGDQAPSTPASMMVP